MSKTEELKAAFSRVRKLDEAIDGNSMSIS